MANAKISDAAFISTTDVTTIDGFAAYSGAANSKISGNALVASLETNLYTAAPLPTTKGGTGSTSTTYCNLTSNVFGVLPKTNGGSNNIIQVFTWTNGSPVNYSNIPQGALYYMPCDTSPIINVEQAGGGAPGIQGFSCGNAAGGWPNPFGGAAVVTEDATWTAGAAAGGVWHIETIQHWFDQNGQIEVIGSIEFTNALGTTTVNYGVIDEKSTELSSTNGKIFYGSKYITFAPGDTFKVGIQFQNGPGGNFPFPSDSPSTGNNSGMPALEVRCTKIM